MISTTPRRYESASQDETEVHVELEDGAVIIDGSPPESSPPQERSGRRRLPYLVALVIAVVILVLGVVYYLTSAVDVQLSIDGQQTALETRADTVAQLLEDQGVEVSDQDFVAPDLDSELSDGTAVEFRHARPLTVTVDGVETEHTTTELTLAAALAAIDAPVEDAAVTPPLSQELGLDGTAVEIITPKQITIDDGGSTRSITTTAGTVEDLLVDNDIILSDTDKLAPSAETTVTAAMTVTITRIQVEEDVRTETIAHDTVERKDGDLTVGTRRTDTEGVDGEKDVTYSITRTNGEITSEEVVSSTVTKEPVSAVVRVGTKPAPVAPAADPGASAGGAATGLNWAALANCESSGNPSAVNPAGYYGLYQFSLSTWASVGGSGNPADASVAEQTKRAQILYNRSGAGQWPHCGKYLFS